MKKQKQETHEERSSKRGHTWRDAYAEGAHDADEIQASQYEAEIAKLKRIIKHMAKILKNLDKQEAKIKRWAKKLIREGSDLRGFGNSMYVTGKEILKQIEERDNEREKDKGA